MLKRVFAQNLGKFWIYSWGAFWGEHPKLVEWIHFKNFGFKGNLVVKTLSELKQVHCLTK